MGDIANHYAHNRTRVIIKHGACVERWKHFCNGPETAQTYNERLMSRYLSLRSKTNRTPAEEKELQQLSVSPSILGGGLRYN